MKICKQRIPYNIVARLEPMNNAPNVLSNAKIAAPGTGMGELDSTLGVRSTAAGTRLGDMLLQTSARFSWGKASGGGTAFIYIDATDVRFDLRVTEIVQ